jgi:hypothetical protein
VIKRYNPQLFSTQSQPGDLISLPIIEPLAEGETEQILKEG